jgi:hypothetical protein
MWSMGTRNRERRRVKQAARARHQQKAAARADAGSSSRSSASVREMVERLVQGAARRGCGSQMLDRFVEAEPALVAAVIRSQLRDAACVALANGWSVTDVWQVVRRRATQLAASVLLGTLDDAVRVTCPLEEQPLALEELGLLGAAVALDPAGAAAAGGWPAVAGAGIRALGVVGQLYRVEDLRSVRSGTARPATTPQQAALLGKVRALLAKAESTQFDEEADALTAKATELMTRHRIDRAALQADEPAGNRSDVGARRCWLEEPYFVAKSLLLSVVASANRCKSVRSEYGYTTIVGNPEDLDLTELLFTSLLVHATRRIALLGTEGQHQRQAAFRRSFLIGFANRISVRLREVEQATTEAARAEIGDAFLPVLARDTDAVEDAVGRLFGRLKSSTISVGDRRGYVAGIVAADQADLAVRPKLAETG